MGPWLDLLVVPIFKLFGACKSMEEYGFRKDQNQNPLIQDCQKNLFSTYYTSPESMTLFRSIYENHLGMQDKLINYWDIVASRFSRNQYIVGFDPFNEPTPSFNGLASIVNMLWPGKYDRYVLQPLYEKIF